MADDELLEAVNDLGQTTKVLGLVLLRLSQHIGVPYKSHELETLEDQLGV